MPGSLRQTCLEGQPHQQLLSKDKTFEKPLAEQTASPTLSKAFTFKSQATDTEPPEKTGARVQEPKQKFMADTANKYSENVGGNIYVDDQCIDCDLCRETAPDNFTRSDDGGYSYVYNQPTTP
ncbi:MAG: ferredoxin, partial [Verrucomicrobiales bacterium]